MKDKFIWFDVLNTAVIALFVLAIFIPVWYIFVISTSTYSAYIADPYHMLPTSFTLQEYQRALMRTRELTLSFWVTIKVTAVGTALSMLFTVIGGYALSKNKLPGRNLIFRLIIVTMFFGGGLAPTYILIRGLGMNNTIWALTLPGAIATYNLILMKNFFTTVNPSLEEAAKIDGYNDVQILLRVVLPMSKPMLAAISLFYAVGYWNDYFNAIIYSSSQNLIPFQMYLRNLIIVNSAAGRAGVQTGITAYEQFKMAVIIVGIVPVLAVYPFVQKHFTKGVVLGSVKE
ncbi:MAG: carbohydrate ABC transporter permease [Clostridiales bacterium]|nr:carbohydrate ABC transporter permease [Clostridiales bacterium]